MAAGFDGGGAIHLLDLERLEEIAAFSAPDAYAPFASAFSPDGGTLAVLTGRGALIELWDLRHIRSTLSSMGLDWNHPPIPPAQPRGSLMPLHLEADLGLFAPSSSTGNTQH